jgi:hypothetical protein
VFVASLSRGEVRAVSGSPDGMPLDDFSAGQPVFTPDGQSVVYTAWSNQPRRLGTPVVPVVVL